MKIGITFGGYCPLHQGHMDLIMRAKKENDICMVIVCGYEGEVRGESYGLPLNKRVCLVKETFKNDEQIHVLSVNDTSLGIDESMSESNWDIWLDHVSKLIDDYLWDNDIFTEHFHNGNYTFYVAEPNYKESIDKRKNTNNEWTRRGVICENCVLLDKVNPISGTLIRSNPIKYWNKIAVPYRKYFSKNILITGTASEGKSTLTRDIATYFGLPYSEEYGRTYMADKCQKDTDLTYFEFSEFLMGQYKDTREKIDSLSNPGVVISDTDALVTMMYMKAYTDDNNININHGDYDRLKMFAYNLTKMIDWDVIFLLPPKNNFVDDGTRYMEQSSIEERQKNFTNLKNDLFMYGLLDKVILLDGNYMENFETVKNYINNIYEQ